MDHETLITQVADSVAAHLSNKANANSDMAALIGLVCEALALGQPAATPDANGARAVAISDDRF